jgi:AraC-like DNA-binding protein
LPIRTCSRALQRAGLAPARLFVRAARVIRAYHYLRGGSDRVIDVALRLGYGTPDALARDTRDVTGCRPSALVHTVRPDALVAIVADRLTRRPATRPAQQTRDGADVASSSGAPGDDVDREGEPPTGQGHARPPPCDGLMPSATRDEEVPATRPPARRADRRLPVAARSP